MFQTKHTSIIDVKLVINVSFVALDVERRGSATVRARPRVKTKLDAKAKQKIVRIVMVK